MPSNLLTADTTFPTLTREQSTDEKFDKITSYLYMLLEQLRYSMGNLDKDNFNAAGLDEIANIITEPVYVQLKDDEANIAALLVEAKGLGLRLENAEGDITSLTATANGLTSRVTDAEGNIGVLQTTAESLQSQITTVDGKASKVTQTVEGLTVTTSDPTSGSSTTRIKGSSVDTTDLNLKGRIAFSDLNSDTQSTINSASQTAAEAKTAANAANANASAASSQVQAWTYTGSTQIDGSKIMTGTVRASILAGGAVQLLGYNTLGQETTAGTMTMTPASTSAFAVQLESTGALRLISALGSAAFLGAGGQSGPHGFVQCGYEPGGTTTGVLVGGAQFAPAGSGGMSCGAAAHLWSAVYAQSGTIQTSDLTHKEDVEALPEKYLAMLDAVTPRRFRLKEGTSGRYHVGFIAQEVEAAMAAAGVSDMEFGGWVKDTDEDGNDLYLLRYEEFIALLLEKLRQLEGRLEALE